MSPERFGPAHRAHSHSFGYQPALDGVRALAVAAVLVFHGEPRWLPGGFLGVDTFFVLSGFLITALLLAERERLGYIRLGAFWLRRARRLLPALVVVVAAVAVTAPALLPPEELTNLRGDALAALGYLANWRMIYRGGDYFAQTSTASPLQHTWSLGIEEQFYLLWPLLVGAVVGFAARPRRAVVAVATAGAIGSAAVAAVLYRPVALDRVYYGTDTRAAALLVGCALAAGLPALARPLRPAWVAAGGVLLIGLAWWRATGSAGWLYRGGLPVLAIATAAVLGHAVTVPAGPAARALSLPPLVWLGRISYGVYLWHWPWYAVLTGERTGLTGGSLLALRAAVTLAAATASYWIVERPVRRARPAAWRLIAPAGATALACTIGAVLAVPLLGNLRADGTTAGAPAGGRPAPVVAAPSTRSPTGPAPRAGRRPGPPRITILGDSVAWTLGAYLPPARGVVIHNRAVQGCGIARLPDIRYLDAPHTNYPGCTSWDRRWRRAVAADDPDLTVLLLDRWELMDRKLDGRYQHIGDPAYDAYLRAELSRALSIAKSGGARAVVLTAPYTHRSERPDGGLYPEDTPGRVDAWNRLLRAVVATDPTHPVVLDLNRVVCPDGRFTWTVGSVRVRSDGLHFTPAGVRTVIAPWLLVQLTQLASAVAG